MTRTMAERWRERQTAWRAFAQWTPDESTREMATRLRWLEDALRLARSLGGLRPDPIDSPEIRAHRSRIRHALAKIRE